MNRKEFLRTTPESVGIASGSIHRLLDRLESGFTEMHGLQILRHGKICLEGWWNPYAPGICHNLMSVTKTYTATAIGIAYTEGILKLTDRLIDIFPDDAPEKPDELLKLLTIRDLLCMGSGMESEPVPTKNWKKDFLATPIAYRPGTRFRYNSVGSSLLGAIIKKRTGLGLLAYLKPRLFDLIGIDADNLLWETMPDGMESGGAGLFATAEDNLRLMLLYSNGGTWEGTRILAEDFVRQAISPQIDSAVQAELYPFAKDSFCGYGYQIWMCQPDGVYRADGAMGQFAIVDPRLDLIVSILETGRGIDGPQKTLDAVWSFLEEIRSAKPVTEHPADCEPLLERLAALSLPQPEYKPMSALADRFSNRNYRVTKGCLCLENQTLAAFCGLPLTKGISSFQFSFKPDICAMQFVQDGVSHSVTIATDGTRALNKLKVTDSIATLVYLSGYWADENTFLLKARWIETSFEKDIRFHFDGSECRITTSDPLGSVGPMGELNERPAVFELRISS
ncbi:MAG TPA: serine hydrolase [Feifaniaceae bacterium]|nr:serine hydrolase [Feifaniaceae bacterium]